MREHMKEMLLHAVIITPISKRFYDSLVLPHIIIKEKKHCSLLFPFLLTEMFSVC